MTLVGWLLAMTMVLVPLAPTTARPMDPFTATGPTLKAERGAFNTGSECVQVLPHMRRTGSKLLKVNQLAHLLGKAVRRHE